MIHAIAAIGKNRELGKGNRLLWAIPEDLRRFKALTAGHPVIMGRKTFESIGKPLPGRTNVVVTRNAEWVHDGVARADSIEKALEIAQNSPGGEEIFVIGGAEIYAAALPLTDILDLTLVDASAEADAYFPPYEDVFVRVLAGEGGSTAGLSYRWVTLGR